MLPLECASRSCLEHDQAFHNYLLWSGKLSPVRASSNEEGPITTIGWPEHLYRDRFGRVLNRRGELVHVVHQFDRRPQLMVSLGQRYSLVAKPESPPRTSAPVDTASAFASDGYVRTDGPDRMGHAKMVPNLLASARG